MTYIITALISGAVGACVAMLVIASRTPKAEVETVTSANSEDLNEEKRRRAEQLKERDRQFDQMMSYIGKEQRV